MNNIITVISPFDIIDYKNENVLSSYALSATPLKFISYNLNGIRNKVLWSFGDNTFSEDLTAVKYYKYPGKYTVNLTLYDCYNNSKVSSQVSQISIFDYLTHTFSIDTSGENSDISIKTSQIHGPWKINATYPYYQNKSSIFYEVVGSKSKHHQTQNNNKYGHLENTYGIYEKFLNKGTNSYQFNEISQIEIPTSDIYAKIYNNQIYICPQSDENSFFVGASGYHDIYFKDDSPSERDIIEFYFDKTNIFSHLEEQHVSYFNNSSIYLSCSVVENEDFDRLSITSTGLDGEYYPISSFEINPIQFENQKLQFVVKSKDILNFSIKTIETFEISIFYNGNYYISDTTILSSFDGSYILEKNTKDIINSLPLSAVSPYGPIKISAWDGVTYYYSSEFYIYPKDYYKMSKKNENFDMGQILKDLRFQETLLDKHVLFDDFLGSIYNNKNPVDNNLGTKIYEKTSNFVENIQDVDRNEITPLISQLKMFDSNILNIVTTYPTSIQRILNLISISKNKLFGYKNKFSNNFDIKGRSSKEIYGKNIGNEINTLYYTITAGIPIVALEKFSNTYTKINTYNWDYNTTVKLSSYNSDWGWPLVLPNNFNTLDFPKYYLFFEYVDAFDDTVVDYTIDFNNSMTTVPQTASYSQLYDNNGIFEHILMDKLTSQLILSA